MAVVWGTMFELPHRGRKHAKNLTEGHAIAVKIVDTFHTCPIPEIPRGVHRPQYAHRCTRTRTHEARLFPILWLAPIHNCG